MPSSADDLWAQMQQEEKRYTKSSKNRMNHATSRSLASLNPQAPAPSRRKQRDHGPLAAVHVQNVCMQMPRFSATPETAKVPMTEQLDAAVTIALDPETAGQLATTPAAGDSGQKHVSIADQYEDTLTNTARDLNLLSAEHKSKRLQAVRTLHAKLLEPPLNATVLALSLPHIIKPILKRFEDPVESVRDEAVRLLSELLHASADIDQVLPYVLPVTLDRLRAARPIKSVIEQHEPSLAPKLPPELQPMEDEEGSEEVRFQMMQMLSTRLIPRLTPIDAMPYLPDLSACIVRGCNHAAPQVVKEACNCALALATALYHEQYKASILKPYTERITLGLMYALYHKQARVRTQAVRALGMVVLAGESKLVQDLAAWNPPNLLDLTQYYHPRARRNTLAHLAGDKSALVREVFYEMLDKLLRSIWLAAEEDTRLLPYVISGTYDPMPELAKTCVKIIESLGERHEELNEKDFEDIHDYAADEPRPGVQWLPPLSKRPCLGARVLVRSRLNKCLESLCKELLDENNNDENRIKCARLLAVHCQYSESGMTGDAHQLVGIALGAGGHPLLHAELQAPLQNLGHYLEPELYLPLALPHLRKAGLGHPELARLVTSLGTMVSASWATEQAAAGKDARVGGLQRVGDSTLAEVLAELCNPAYCRSSHLPLRVALAELLCILANHPGLPQRVFSTGELTAIEKKSFVKPYKAGSGGVPLMIFAALAHMRALVAPETALAQVCTAGIDALLNAACNGGKGADMATVFLQQWPKVEGTVKRELAHKTALLANARRAASLRNSSQSQATPMQATATENLLGASVTDEQSTEQVELPTWFTEIKLKLEERFPNVTALDFSSAVRITVEEDGSDSDEEADQREIAETAEGDRENKASLQPADKYTRSQNSDAASKPGDSDLRRRFISSIDEERTLAAARENAKVDAPAEWRVAEGRFDADEAAGWFEEKLGSVRHHRATREEVVRQYGSEEEFAARLRQTIAVAETESEVAKANRPPGAEETVQKRGMWTRRDGFQMFDAPAKSVELDELAQSVDHAPIPEDDHSTTQMQDSKRQPASAAVASALKELGYASGTAARPDVRDRDIGVAPEFTKSQRIQIEEATDSDDVSDDEATALDANQNQALAPKNFSKSVRISVEEASSDSDDESAGDVTTMTSSISVPQQMRSGVVLANAPEPEPQIWTDFD